MQARRWVLLLIASNVVVMMHDLGRRRYRQLVIVRCRNERNISGLRQVSAARGSADPTLRCRLLLLKLIVAMQVALRLR